MNYRKYNRLIINNLLLEGSEIPAYCGLQHETHFQKIGNFIHSWLDDSATLEVRTSGSTGKAKTIRVEKQQMLESAAATARFFEFQKGQTALLALPVDYIAGKMMLVRALFSELNLVCIAPGRQPFNDLPEDLAIDFAPLTPMQLKGVQHTHQIKTILLGGGPVSREMEDELQNLSTAVFHGYGMTETLSHVALRSVNGNDASDVYRALPNVHFEKDERDCLVIHVSFLKEPVITNDVVTLLNEREFIWNGRFDNVINSGGIKLFPENIEKKLYPFISEQFFVSGISDAMLGEKLILFVEGESYSKTKLAKLWNKIEAILDKYDKPKAIKFVPQFLMTESGKIKRGETVRLAIDE